ncbi:MAG: ABC transporter permease [Proteobacteria bacterium]|nr:ABC transporter permease [Pseudomonadota bacterium]MBU1709523.1 ABC transporter permease [Pseudomonadota bacterium]
MKKIIEKQINLLDYSLASLWRRKLKNISVLLVFAAVIFLLGSLQLVNTGLTRAAAENLKYAPEITIQRMSAGRQEAIPLSYIDALSTIFGIRTIVPRIWGYYFDESKLANYTVIGLDASKMPMGDKLGFTLKNGRFPGADERGGVVVGNSALDIMALKDRKVISFFRPDLTIKSLAIVGVFKDETDMLTADLLAMNIEDAADLFKVPGGMVTDLCIYVSNPREINTIAQKIASLLPDTRVITKPQIMKTYQVVFGWRSGFASVCLLTALAAFIILAWDKASGLSPEERREIGILKILGWETNDILIIRFWESFLVSILAFILGCTMAYAHVAFFDAALFRPVLFGWSVIYPSLKILPNVTFSDLLLIFSISVLPYLAATVIPAWRCAIVPADSAIR